MKRNILKLLYIIGAPCLLLLGSGCALTKDYCDIEYTLQPGVSKVLGAENVSVKVSVTDSRIDKEKVSCKKNGYGMEMAPIISNTEVERIMLSAVKAELEQRGFNVQDGTIVVSIEINKFYNDFKMGMWSGAASAEVTCNAKVLDANGTIKFAQSFTGTHLHKPIQLASGKNTEIALNGALKELVSKLMSDKAFIDAILQAGN